MIWGLSEDSVRALAGQRVRLRRRSLLRQRGSVFYRIDLLRREPRRQHHLQHFNVLAVAQFAVADAGRLVDARTRLQPHGALALVLELDPALEDVHQLEFGVVPVRLAGEVLPRGRADDVGFDAPLGGLPDAQVALFEERAQAALEAGIPSMGDGETLCGHETLLFRGSIRVRRGEWPWP